MLSTALCTYCHGSDFSGAAILDDARIGHFYAKNLTPGGETKNFSDADWINAIRFGVKKNGSPIFIMPSDSYNSLGDDDLGCIIAYLKSLKASGTKDLSAVDRITFYGKIAIQTGKFGHELFAAESINMADNAPRHSPASTGAPAYGSYLATMLYCNYCHGPRLNGAIDTGTTAPPAPNITPGGNLGHWNAAQFITTIRSGITPSGKHLSPEFMPWPNIAMLDDTSLEAIYAFLKSQPILKDSK